MAVIRKTTKRKPSTRSRTQKLQPFAPLRDDKEIARPVPVDMRVIRLEWASVLLGILSVFVAALGYWYVFGKPLTAPRAGNQAAIPDGAIVEHAAPAQSENYKLDSVPTVADNTPQAEYGSSPDMFHVEIYSTIPTKGAAATLRKELLAVGFTDVVVDNARPTRTVSSVAVTDGQGDSSIGERVYGIVAKHYAVGPLGYIQSSSTKTYQPRIIVYIGSTPAPAK